MKQHKLTRAQESRGAIQRLQTAMRHLFIRGGYKPLGVSGEAMIESLLTLNPEIYGSIADPEKIELGGLLYIYQRLPIGIEQARYVKLIAREGFENSTFTPIVPSKRRRNCYRIDDEQMYIEMTRGRSDIYDVLTHLTFMYVEAEKIRKNALDSKGRPTRSWKVLEQIVKGTIDESYNPEVGYTYLASILGRTYDETLVACENFENADGVNSLFDIVYWMGLRSMEEHFDDIDREIGFSPTLRDTVGQHINGEYWANQIKAYLTEQNLIDKEIHVISANLHSVMNCLFAKQAIKDSKKYDTLEDLAEVLSQPESKSKRDAISKYAAKNGMAVLHDISRTNISVQIIDLDKVDVKALPKEIKSTNISGKVLVVMDYAFGEQAFESIDELLKPFDEDDHKKYMNIHSINIMGKAGILCGNKGDIMLPNAHVFEGSADNYVFENDLNIEDLTDPLLQTFEGPMITVLGTSLQNKDILRYFLKSSWKAVGLEMEGAHYLKAIQAASKIRGNVKRDITIRNAYYASDNPLETGSTLASGSLGLDGVKPTYLITVAFLNGIFNK